MKKGALTLNYIILMILALIVLVVVLLIFQQQVSEFAKTISELIGGYGGQAREASSGLQP